MTIISADEQFQGRLALIRRAKTQMDAAREYDRLRETIQFFASVHILPYDAAAVAQFEALRKSWAPDRNPGFTHRRDLSVASGNAGNA
ncbi:MAG: hypothetical protein ACLFVO_14085 [Chloroflexaceae bacterium]